MITFKLAKGIEKYAGSLGVVLSMITFKLPRKEE